MTALQDKLQFAVKYKVHAGDIGVLVEEPPLIDTVKVDNRFALLLADIRITGDPEITLDVIKDSERVMYWKLDDNAQATNIIGLAWEGETVYFFEGEVLPP